MLHLRKLWCEDDILQSSKKDKDKSRISAGQNLYIVQNTDLATMVNLKLVLQLDVRDVKFMCLEEIQWNIAFHFFSFFFQLMLKCWVNCDQQKLIWIDSMNVTECEVDQRELFWCDVSLLGHKIFKEKHALRLTKGNIFQADTTVDGSG